ncbi:hypothetical protein M9H77_20681 [Catharanthus roseus]|uniref:Uncharacterized protein n=1 Tax=Catharanthus roseus TaxID=4058 RepID=A0ACC0APK2_CATRO|nr:hypothetical protein M9H77_20681 [Catharanthus roseus]
MDESEVQVLSRTLLKPSSPTPEHLRYYKLSLFDQLAPPSFIRIFLCYTSSSDDLEKSQTFNRLKKSLSDTLTKFYPFAGRILEDGLSIDCSDQGIEYFEGEASKGLDEFLHDGLKVEILDEFVPKDLSGFDLTDRPLVSVQISMFRCGGISIGLSVSHKISDTSTLIQFMNGWASTSKEGICTMISPNFTVPSIFPSRQELGRVYPELGASNLSIVTRRFTFKGSLISKFRNKFRETFGSRNNHHHQPSRVTVVTAVIWKALINVSQQKHGHLRPSLLSPAMSLRGKAALKTSENSFGNLWMPVIAHFNPEMGKLDLLDLVSILDDAVRTTAENIKKARTHEIFSMATKGIKEVIDEKLNNNGLDVFTCTSWCRFPINEADFGWGKPFKVSSLSRPYEMFTLWDSRYGDSIEALVCLNEKDMAKLNLDQDLLAFTSSSSIDIGSF